MKQSSQNPTPENPSLETLKEKFTDKPTEADAQMDALMADLEEMSEGIEKTNPKAETKPEPKAETTETKPQENEYKSIFDDVLQSVMQTSPEEKTSRQSKFQEQEKQFVDVTQAYETYGTVHTEPEEPEALPQYDIKASTPLAAETAKAKSGYRSFGDMFRSFCQKAFPTKGDSVGEGVRKIVADVAIVVLVFCIGYFGVYGINSVRAKKQQEVLSGYIIPDGFEDPNMEGDEWAQFLSKYPNVQFPDGMMKKYAYLYAINPELVGWVRVPNTMINIQVVQSDSSEPKYIRRDFYGNKSRYGTPYMDYRNDPKYLDKNTTIYGHHMSDGLVFADLKKYKELDGFKESPIFYFDTLYKTYAFKVYAVLITNSRPEDDDGYAFNYTIPNFKSNDHFMSYMKAVDERSLYKTGVDVQPSDKLLTLSTCTYEFSNARLAVIGRMVRPGESEKVDLSLAEVNENPRYPQAWYDKKGIDNPYAGAEKWYY